MSNIKRRIASFVAAFAMLGTVTVPSIAEYVSNDTVAVAAPVAGLKEGKYLQVESVNFYVYGVFDGIIKKYHVSKIYADSRWVTYYYLEERKEWVTQKNAKLVPNLFYLNIMGSVKAGTKVYQSYNTKSRVRDSQFYAIKRDISVIKEVKRDYYGKEWYYIEINDKNNWIKGWICSDNVKIDLAWI